MNLFIHEVKSLKLSQITLFHHQIDLHENGFTRHGLACFNCFNFTLFANYHTHREYTIYSITTESY